MKKMTIRKMLERIVVATNKRRAKNIVLVSTDGEIVEAEFAVDLIRTPSFLKSFTKTVSS
jgi:hypothetical protein